MIFNALILYRHALPKQANKLLKKAKKRAYKEHKYDAVLKVIKYVLHQMIIIYLNILIIMVYIIL